MKAVVTFDNGQRIVAEIQPLVQGGASAEAEVLGGVGARLRGAVEQEPAQGRA